MTGVCLIIEPFSGYLDLDTAQVLLAVGLALLGAIGLVPAYRGLSRPDERIADLTINLGLIGLALLTLLGLASDTSPIEILGWLAILAGAALIASAVVRGRRRRPPDQQASQPAPPATADRAPDDAVATAPSQPTAPAADPGDA